MTRKIIHVDMDAFYAAIEQRDHPEYRHRPVVVGGPPNSRSVVCTASYEARKFGIHSAMPSSQAYRLCPRAVFVMPRFAVYKEVSQQIISIFHEYTDLVEPLSLDEAYLDVTRNHKHNPSATWIAREVQSRIKQETGLTASAGVSYCKFLAKVASDYKKPAGLTVITPEEAQGFLDALPVAKFYGIGRITAARMQEHGIQQGSDLRAWSREDLARYFGKMGLYYYEMVRGIDERPVNIYRERKSLSLEHTFDTDIDDRNDMHQILEDLAQELENRMEKRALLGRTLVLKVRYEDFQRITRSQTVAYPLRSAAASAEIARELLSLTDAGRKKVRLLGLGFQNLVDENNMLEQTDEQLWLPFPGESGLQAKHADIVFK